MRDYTFLIYQTNVVLAMGSIGGIVVLAMLIRRLWGKGADRDQRRFWWTFVLGGFVAGVAVVGEKDYYGLAHLCLQPVVLMGVTFLAANLPPLPSAARCVLAAGAAVDFAVGVLLQLSIENITVQHLRIQDDHTYVSLNDLPVTKAAMDSLYTKFTCSLSFWGDNPALFLQLALVVGCVVMLWRVLMAGRRRPGRVDPGGGRGPKGTTSGSAAATP